MLRLLYLVSALTAVLLAISAPENFTVMSQNFHHILHWSPGRNSTPSTTFRLRSSCSKDPVMTLSNTSVDVSGRVTDIFSRCTFTLWASSENRTSSRVRLSFTPYSDTIIGPPGVSLSGCGDCLEIHITLPKRSNETQFLRFYASVTYMMQWKEANDDRVGVINLSEENYTLRNLQPGHQYCVKVFPEINFNSHLVPSAWHCEYTSKEEPREVSGNVLGWSLAALLCGAVVLVMMVLFYIGSLRMRKTPLPQSPRNISVGRCLVPEQVPISCLVLTTVMSSKEPLTGRPRLNVKQNSQDKQDPEDEEDGEDEGRCAYMGVTADNGIFSCANDSSPVIEDVEDEASPEHTHHSHYDCKRQEVMSEVSEATSRPPDELTETLELEERDDDGCGNVNLLSVTLRCVGAEDDLLQPLLRNTEERPPADLDFSSALGCSVRHAGSEQPRNSISEEEEEEDWCGSDYIAR